MSDNWIVGNLQSAFNTWNDKLAEIWSLITTTPQEFRGGDIWTVIVGINDGLKAVGYGLLVLFFAMSVFQSAAGFRDFQRPEFALRHLIRFVAAKVAVGSAMEIMTVIFAICGGIVQSVMSGIGGMASASVTVPQEMVDTIEAVGFLQSIPLWLVTFIGSLFITILSFILIMTVYGRFFSPVFLYRLGPAAPGFFCGRGDQFCRQSLSQVLRRRVHGGRCHCPGLHDLLRVCLHQRPGVGYFSVCRHHVLAVCGGDHFQYAGAGGPG